MPGHTIERPASRGRQPLGCDFVKSEPRETTLPPQTNQVEPERHARVIDDPRFRWMVGRIHDLGPRALGELLVEIDADRDTLERNARMPREWVIMFDGDR